VKTNVISEKSLEFGVRMVKLNLRDDVVELLRLLASIIIKIKEKMSKA